MSRNHVRRAKFLTSPSNLFVLATLFSAHIVFAGPVVKSHTEFYDVAVTDVKSLMSVMNETSPVRQDGEVFFAYAHTKVDWKFQWDMSDRCKLASVNTAVAITYTMPNWDLSAASDEVIEIWQKYYLQLAEHEAGHGKLAIDAALEIEKTIMSMPSFKSCDRLKVSANSKATKIMNRLKTSNRDYDKKTGHGETQGAYLGDYIKSSSPSLFDRVEKWLENLL